MQRWLNHLMWIVPILIWADSCLRPISEPDLFFYLALVQTYLRDGHWPMTDPFVYSLPNDSLVTLHQWLGYWCYYLPFAAFSWAGPILLMTVLVGLLFSIPLLLLKIRAHASPWYYPLIWTAALFVSYHRFRQRVSLFGDLFVILLTAGLLQFCETLWLWWSLPVLFLIWAQFHPSFPLGWVILGLFFIGRSPRLWRKDQIVSATLCVLAPLCNPLGWKGWVYPISFALHTEPYLRRYVVEWLPLTDSRLWMFRFLYFGFITFVPFAAFLIWKYQRRSFFHWTVFALALALNLKSVRFGMIAQGLFLLLLVDVELKKPRREHQPVALWKLSMATTMALALMVFKIATSHNKDLTFADRFTVDATYFPIEAVNFLDQTHPRQNIYNSFGFGGYLAWRWLGHPPIFFHGFSTNFDFYEKNYIAPQLDVNELRRVISQYNVGIFLISKMGNDNPFISFLQSDEHWQKLREDNVSVLFVNRDPKVFQ